LRDAIDRQPEETRVTDTGFAIGELILAAAEAAPMLCVGLGEDHRKAGARLVRALEGVGVDRARLSIIPATDILKSAAVPLVMYFRNQEEADQFSELVRDALGSRTHEQSV
jgi:hypothetical protein